MALSILSILLGSSLILQASGTPLPTSSRCCHLLDSEFRGGEKVVYPQTSEYGVLNTYFAPTSQQSPSCIFTPSDTFDISRAIKLFTRHSCKFAIRSGGHHYNAGWASINNGILLSLSNLNKVIYNPSSQSVFVGSGNRWRKVYNTVEPYGRTVVGAQNSDVGVGGFLINGGISFLADQYGWAVDNVREFEIVVADGRVLKANKYENKDLFRALKGGSSNFGVVTGFTLDTVESKLATGAYVEFPTSSYDAFINAAYQYCVKGEDPKSQVLFISWLTVKNGAISVKDALSLIYTDIMDVSNPPKALAPFMDKKIPSSLVQILGRNQTMGSHGHDLTQIQHPGVRTIRQTISIIPDAQLLKNFQRILVKTAEQYKYIEGFTTDLLFQPIGKKWIAAGNAKGGNSMGLTVPVIILWVQPHWVSGKDDGIIAEFVTKVIMQFEKAAKDAGKLSKFEYLNYAGPKQGLMEGYGAESIRRLQSVKRNYDPKNVFGTLLPGGPKIPGLY
ncbi:hypothetical protein TWF106_001449 [Orbilia oligospora]|uniref:Uncharacterized protein n=1 Tax=Orbilia oligospora TaxID=2813651 RepID=A0A6G1MA95_ORBOL|nr:hypothetical protein TWF106_001449 [Orbilia oligospora]KAF3249055.1 hypothetical protein TWF192_006003 [Orbilia oligospora]